MLKQLGIFTRATTALKNYLVKLCYFQLAKKKKKKKFLKSRKRKKNFHPQNVLELKRYINKCLICHKKKLF